MTEKNKDLLRYRFHWLQMIQKSVKKLAQSGGREYNRHEFFCTYYIEISFDF